MPFGFCQTGVGRLPADAGKGDTVTTLLELSIQYADGAAAIHTRIRELEQLERIQTDPVCAQALRRRILELTPLWRDMREMTRRTAHYYDRRH